MATNENKLKDNGPSDGTIDGKNIRVLSILKDCDKEECPIFKSCKYTKRGKCKVQFEFVNRLYLDWVDPNYGIGDRINQVQLDQIGTTILPLLLDLISFRMEIFTLKKTTYQTDKGVWMAYPQYKESRETIALITKILKEMGIIDVWEKKFGKDAPGPMSKIAKVENIMKKGQGYEVAMGLDQNAYPKKEKALNEG